VEVLGRGKVDVIRGIHAQVIESRGEGESIRETVFFVSSVALLAEFVHGEGLFQIEAAEEFFHVFGEDVAFQIDACAGAVSA
jgi:hypothetical protein